MNIVENISLRNYNTFGMDVPAEMLVTVTNVEELPAVARLAAKPRIMGGGSNILLTAPVDGLILLNRLKGIAIEKEDASHAWVRVAAGEVWHDFVLFAINNNFGGIENLALIPGTVGASPIQNIGAYGVEVKDTIESVDVWLWDELKMLTLANAACRFGYRDSIFKHELKDKVLVTSVLFRLSKKPDLHTSYGAITQELRSMDLAPSVKNIAQAVINIRQSKLPDPKQIGNAGSFFKNPVITRVQYDGLKAVYPGMPCYPATETTVKVPAGWLIEYAGWKGYRKGDAGVHAKQALVLVNYGAATGREIWSLSDEVIASIQQRFDIVLEREVQVW